MLREKTPLNFFEKPRASANVVTDNDRSLVGTAEVAFNQLPAS